MYTNVSEIMSQEKSKINREWLSRRWWKSGERSRGKQLCVQIDLIQLQVMGANKPTCGNYHWIQVWKLDKIIIIELMPNDFLLRYWPFLWARLLRIVYALPCLLMEITNYQNGVCLTLQMILLSSYLGCIS